VCPNPAAPGPARGSQRDVSCQKASVWNMELRLEALPQASVDFRGRSAHANLVFRNVRRIVCFRPLSVHLTPGGTR
jgi:hypothetical protein